MQERGALVPNGIPARTAGGAWPQVLPSVPGAGWVWAYVAIEIGCQLALLVPFLNPARVLFRSAAIGASLFMLAFVPGRPAVHHPARPFVVASIVVLTLAALNPLGGTPLSVAAHWCFCLAVLAPLFWVMRLDLPENTLTRLLIVLWLFSTASSIFGVLQVYFPGRFQPAISSLIQPGQVMAIRLSSGTWVVRPMGLTDMPGGAGWSGLYATLFGLGIALAEPFRRARLAGVLSMVMGITCIYICQIRAMLVMLGICALMLVGILALSGRMSRMALTVIIAGTIALVGFYLAISLAGDAVTSRLSTLVDSDPGSVYHRSRGRMVEAAFTELLPEFPLGGGLGRWGMMNQYFGTPEGSRWIEVQWGGWILDGGILLALAYPAAIVAGIWTATRAALDPMSGDRGLWAAIVAAHGLGTLALTFSYPIFMSTGGIQFWLINAVFVRSLLGPRALQASPRPS